MSVGRGSGLRTRHRRHSLIRTLQRRLALQRAAGASEAGVTLTELLVVLVIMPLILGAIAAAVITSFQDQQGVSSRLTDSSSAKTTSAYFVRDVQSATSVTTNQATTSPAQCGSGTTFELGLSWGNPAAGTSVVTYWATSVAGTPATWNLVRQFCTNGSTTPLSSVNVASGLLSVPTLPTPTPAFTAVVTPQSQANAANTNWTSTAGTSSVAIGALQSASTYNFNLVGVPRLYTPQSLGVTGGGSPDLPPLLLLGTGAPAINCQGSSTGRISVTGQAYLNSAANSSINVGPNASMTATQIVTANLTPSKVITGGGPVTPSTPNYSPPSPDPYGSNPGGNNLQPPSTTGLPVFANGSSHGTTVQPGVYQTTLTFSGNTAFTMASGIYILQQGISVTGGASLTSAPGGVLLYVTATPSPADPNGSIPGTNPPESIQFAGNGAVTISPLPLYTDANTQTAKSLAIWQDKSDTNLVQMSGNGSGNIVSGTVYAPTAQVGGVGNGSFTTGGLISSTLGCAGNGTAFIGG
jgi:hypothetical protein